MVMIKVMLVCSMLGYLAAGLVMFTPILSPRPSLVEAGQLAAGCLIAGFVTGAILGGLAQAFSAWRERRRTHGPIAVH
jgi:hypothetical protein